MYHFLLKFYFLLINSAGAFGEGYVKATGGKLYLKNCKTDDLKFDTISTNPDDVTEIYGYFADNNFSKSNDGIFAKC
jgi:hypothetical protein